MKFIFGIVFLSLFQFSFSQLTCENIKELNVHYKGTDHRNGRTRLFNTDTAITNKMKYLTFELKLASAVTEEEKAELAKYKINFNPTDTIMFYDWDIMHQGKMGYHGKAVARVRINSKDSIMHTYKYLLNPETKNYVPNRFKIFRMNEKDFIISDRNHSYLNINIYFKKD